MYEESHFFPWLTRSFQTRCLNYNETFSAPVHASLRDLNSSTQLLCCPRHSRPWLSHQVGITPNGHGERRYSYIFLFCSLPTSNYTVQFRSKEVVWKVKQKKIPKAGLPLSSLSKGRKRSFQGRKANHKGKHTCWALEVPRNECLQSWRPREKKIREGFTLLTARGK